MFSRQHMFTVGAVMIVLLCACTSRYRLDLYVTEDGQARRVDVNETQYAMGFVAGEALPDQQLIPGSGNSLILTAGTRNRQQAGQRDGVLSFDEYTRYRIWMELPLIVKPGTYPLTGKSVLFVLGRYDQPAASKLFSARSGTFTVDSVAGDRMYATLAGEYRNDSDKPVSVKGQFRARIKK
jgi:hypothetical protein